MTSRVGLLGAAQGYLIDQPVTSRVGSIEVLWWHLFRPASCLKIDPWPEFCSRTLSLTLLFLLASALLTTCYWTLEAFSGIGHYSQLMREVGWLAVEHDFRTGVNIDNPQYATL